MSYYINNYYNFTAHGLLRIKSRLKIQKLSDLEASNYARNLIEKSTDILETKSFQYIKINNTNLYFITKKEEHLVITLTEIKLAKLLAIIEKNE